MGNLDIIKNEQGQKSEDKLFVNKTTYTKDMYVEFLKFHNKKYNPIYIAYTLFWAFLFFLCIILSFDSGSRTQGVLVTIILICFLIYRIVRPQLIVDKEMNSDKLEGNITNTFTFYEKNFEVKNANGKFIYKYSNLRKIFETQDYFYLYVTKENAFLLSKSAFSFGTSYTFSKFIKTKCRFKYMSH